MKHFVRQELVELQPAAEIVGHEDLGVLLFYLIFQNSLAKIQHP